MLPSFDDFSWRKLNRFAVAGLVAMTLSACGGGGGSAGTVPNAPAGSSAAASVTLITGASTIAASGADGTEVTLTAIVKDASNNAVPGAVVSFKADSGSISNTNRIADANGTVVEKLSVKGDPSPRVITITASSGTATSAAKTVTVTTSTAAAPKLLLTASSGALPSSGAAGTAVTIKALVLDANNVVMPATKVTFATDSGSLSASQVITDANGVATVSLATGSDPTTRTITVSGGVAGVPGSTVKVNVAGTRITANASSTVNLGASSDVTVALFDSADAPLANQPVAFSALINSVVAKSGGGSTAFTDAAGKLVLSYTAGKVGNDVITVRALGETASVPVSISTASFSIKAVDLSSGATITSANTGVCYAVQTSNFVSGVAQSGTVTLSTSRGAVYADSACTIPLTGAIALVSGTAQAYVSATGPGIATLSASSSATNSIVQSTLEFIAPLTSSAVISLQGTPAVVGANLPGSSTEQVTLRAVVTDKSSQGNPVKNARVSFSIISDASGGTLSQPSTLLTGSDGSATINYIAGTTTTAVDGVVIQAMVQSAVSAASSQTKLTVAKKSLFISAGTGNLVQMPTSATYQVDYVVFVTDAAGNAVRDVAVTGAVIPRSYMKGVFVNSGIGPWVQAVSATCANEDVNRDGVLGAGEDTNQNGRLDPVIPMNITSSGKTDATGTATISMIYPRDRAYWLDVEFTIRGAVSGSEASYVGYTILPGAASDYSNPASAPPGQVSPYGKSTSCGDTN